MVIISPFATSTRKSFYLLFCNLLSIIILNKKTPQNPKINQKSPQIAPNKQILVEGCFLGYNTNTYLYNNLCYNIVRGVYFRQMKGENQMKKESKKRKEQRESYYRFLYMCAPSMKKLSEELDKSYKEGGRI